MPTPTPKYADVMSFFISIIKNYMNPILTIIPYFTILLANVLYIYFYQFDPIQQWYKIFLFNFCLMMLIGAFLIINLNILLYRWLHDDRKVDEKGNMTKKQLFKKKIKQFIQHQRFLQNLLLPGNQKVLLKIYFGIASWRYLTSFIPGVLMGLFLGTFFQYKGVIYEKFKQPIDKLVDVFWDTVKIVQKSLPQHHSVKKVERMDEITFKKMQQKKMD